ncbi:MAG: DUF362 domain-containing protein [Candidatus Omnitrophota bacterium]
MKSVYEYFNSLLDKKVSREKFLKITFSSLALLLLSGFRPRSAQAVQTQSFGRPKKTINTDHDLIIASGDDPYAMTIKAVEAMGGMGKFVKKGDIVLVKPNMGWDRTPEQAGNTNPQVVAALVDMSFKAGAKKVNVFDITCNDARRCYENSGIEKAAVKSGATVYYPDGWDSLKAKFNYKSQMEGWPILKDAIAADVVINAPVLKHHSLTRLTLSMKNLMGVCGGNRGIIHQNIGEKLVDLTGFINPELTVIDAYRVLVRNGPTGGNLADVDTMKKIIVAADPTLADIVACGIAGVDPSAVPYVHNAIQRNFGITDPLKADILKITV